MAFRVTRKGGVKGLSMSLFYIPMLPMYASMFFPCLLKNPSLAPSTNEAAKSHSCLLCTKLTGPSYRYLPFTKYITTLITKIPKNMTTLQLNDCISTGSEFGQKHQKKPKLEYVTLTALTSIPHRPRL